MRKHNSYKTQILHRSRLRKNKPNTTLQDVRPDGNLQADRIIIPQVDLHIILWETIFDNFPTHSDSKNASDGYSADSDQQDAIITDLDFRSSRQDENTDTAATEQREHEINEADIRSARLQSDTHSAEAEQPAENTADADLQSIRPQQKTDSENDKKPHIALKSKKFCFFYFRVE